MQVSDLDVEKVVQIAPPGRHTVLDDMASPEHVIFVIKVYDIFTLQSSITIYRTQDSESAAVDLIQHGYIAKTPTYPNVAVSIKTLALLYRIRQRKASMSIEAFAKVICDWYPVRFAFS